MAQLLITKNKSDKKIEGSAGKIDRLNYSAIEFQFSGNTKQQYIKTFEVCSNNTCDNCRRPC